LNGERGVEFGYKAVDGIARLAIIELGGVRAGGSGQIGRARGSRKHNIASTAHYDIPTQFRSVAAKKFREVERRARRFQARQNDVVRAAGGGRALGDG